MCPLLNVKCSYASYIIKNNKINPVKLGLSKAWSPTQLEKGTGLPEPQFISSNILFVSCGHWVSHPSRQHCTSVGSGGWWLRPLARRRWLWLRPCSWARWVVVEDALCFNIVVIMGMFPSPASIDEWRKGQGQEGRQRGDKMVKDWS